MLKVPDVCCFWKESTSMANPMEFLFFLGVRLVRPLCCAHAGDGWKLGINSSTSDNGWWWLGCGHLSKRVIIFHRLLCWFTKVTPVTSARPWNNPTRRRHGTHPSVTSMSQPFGSERFGFGVLFAQPVGVSLLPCVLDTVKKRPKLKLPGLDQAASRPVWDATPQIGSTRSERCAEIISQDHHNDMVFCAWRMRT